MKNIYFLIGIICSISCGSFAQVTQVRDTILMGSRFKITLVASNNEIATNRVNSAIDEIVRIENLISDWKPDSQVSRINQNAGIHPVKVDWEVFELTKRAIYYSEITNGAFDISFAAMDKIWNFNDFMDQVPADIEIKNAISKVGYQNIILNASDTTIYLKNKGMKIGFGSIGKGYAADQGRVVLQQLGADSFIVDASGDMATSGQPLDAKYWRIGITNPIKNNLAAILDLKNSAVTTSGDYKKFVLIDGIRYSHIINPKTGWPSTGLTSVTIIGPSAEVANAFSTSIMVLGNDKGKELLNKYPNYAGIFITNEGKLVKTRNYKKVLKSFR